MHAYMHTCTRTYFSIFDCRHLRDQEICGQIYSCSILQAVQDVGSAANAESAMESLWKALAEVIGRSLTSPII